MTICTGSRLLELAIRQYEGLQDRSNSTARPAGLYTMSIAKSCSNKAHLVRVTLACSRIGKLHIRPQYSGRSVESLLGLSKTHRHSNLGVAFARYRQLAVNVLWKMTGYLCSPRDGVSDHVYEVALPQCAQYKHQSTILTCTNFLSCFVGLFLWSRQSMAQ